MRARGVAEVIFRGRRSTLCALEVWTDFLHKSRVNPPKRARRTRLPQKLTLQVCKASVSYETSSKSRVSSLHKERLVLPSRFAIPSPPNNTCSDANPNVTATYTSTTVRNLAILVRNARVGGLTCEYWRKSCTTRSFCTLVLQGLTRDFWRKSPAKRSFCRLEVRVFEEVSYETLVLQTRSASF